MSSHRWILLRCRKCQKTCQSSLLTKECLCGGLMVRAETKAELRREKARREVEELSK